MHAVAGRGRIVPLALVLAFGLACSGGDQAGGGRIGSGGANGGTGAAGSAGSGDFGNTPQGGDSTSGPVAGGGELAPQGERQNIVLDDCPAGLPPDVAAALADPAVPEGSRWLYPYEETVFPRGLTAPVLQWDAPPGGATAARIRLRSMLLDQTICLSLTEPMRVAMPQEAWDRAANQSLGKGDPLSVEVTLGGAGSAVRLPQRKLVFALADLKGAVYYNTYGSAIANQLGAIGGVVMRVLPGEAAPEVFLKSTDPTTCVGCHAVSADGSRMVAEIHGNPGIFEGPSASYDLRATGLNVNPPPLSSTLKRAGFSALYPDGSVYLTTGRIVPGPLGPNGGTVVGNIPGTFGPEESKLYDTASGVEIPGSGIEPFAYMPMFSVDGAMVVFNRMDTSGVGGHTLAVMSFDRATNRFSNQRQVFHDPVKFPGWPFFVPDVVDVETIDGVAVPRARGKRVVFAVGQMPDFVTQEQPLGLLPHVSDLWWADVDSGTSAPLARANGLDPQGGVTLPYGERDAHKNYIPTVSPVAAGGYFWLFFTSKRNYGNLFIADPPESRAEAKKIWVSAIDIDAPPGTDASHPAFFLPGQELESGNIRAFAALEPCREVGAACESGIDCCCGFCREGMCACEEACANLDERCEVAADCCSGSHVCIGGFCGPRVE